jgi:K+/H+ antiporter YhaU regulatory subunit KhtT
MDLRIHEQRLPGIGRRYEFALGDGRIAAVIVGDDGQRVLAVSQEDADEPDVTVAFGEEHAVAIAAILMGARFSIQSGPDPATPEPHVTVETVTLGASSPAVGRVARDVPLPPGSDAAVLAVIRDATPELLEDPEREPCRPGDRLVVAARRERLAEVVELLAG